MKRNCEGFNAGNRHLEVSEGRNKLPKITGVTALGVQRRGVFDLTTSLPLSKLPAHFSANSWWCAIHLGRAWWFAVRAFCL